MNILITSSGRKINLLKYFRRALNNEGGGKILSADSDPATESRYFSDHFLQSPASDNNDFIDWLEQVVKAYAINLIIPSRDGELEVFITAEKPA